jgi:hypothetical protein
MLTRNNFDVPVFEYYKNGGKYSGCKRTEDKNDFNYKIEIEKSEDSKILTVRIWYGIYSFDHSEEISHESFPPDPDGLTKAYEYIDTAYDEWNKKRAMS